MWHEHVLLICLFLHSMFFYLPSREKYKSLICQDDEEKKRKPINAQIQPVSIAYTSEVFAWDGHELDVNIAIFVTDVCDDQAEWQD